MCGCPRSETPKAPLLFKGQALQTTGQKPEQITSDKDTTYSPATLKVLGRKVEHRNSRYLNNRMEQDHRGIKGRYRPMQGFKNEASAERFCASFDEQRNFFRYRRWHNDRWKAGWQRADFKSKFFRLKNKFINRKLIWRQSVMTI